MSAKGPSKDRARSTASKRIRSSKATTSRTDERSTWIPIRKNFVLPQAVRDAIQRLNENGHVAYLVGGGVRDFLLERESKDQDLATDATPDQILEIFPNANAVGQSFGVVKLQTEDSSDLEVATFRKDVSYKNHRHPEKVELAGGIGPREDASRRDFTINGLFYDPKTQRILDFFNGMEDLKNKVIRAIGKAEDRFQEDALRMVRAVRFATALGFNLDKETSRAIESRARLVKKVSPERILMEFNQLLCGPDPARAIELLSEHGLGVHLLPELEAMKGVEQSPVYHPEGDVWVHTLKVLNTLCHEYPKRSATLSWSALLHDVGKPEAARRSGGANFNGHEFIGSALSETICKRFKMSNDDRERIVALVNDHLKFKDVFQMREATLQRWLSENYFGELIKLHRCDCLAGDGNLAHFEFCLRRFEEIEGGDPFVPLVDGTDLIQLGLEPGPRFSEILRSVDDLTMEKKLQTKEQALEFIMKYFVS